MNEPSNGLIRPYRPEGTDLSRLSKAEVKRVEDLLNHRPRKVPGFRTPHEVIHEALKQGESPVEKPVGHRQPVPLCGRRVCMRLQSRRGSVIRLLRIPITFFGIVSDGKRIREAEQHRYARIVNRIGRVAPGARNSHKETDVVKLSENLIRTE